MVACRCTNRNCGIVEMRMRRERQKRGAGREKGNTPLEHNNNFRAKPEKETKQFSSST